MNIDQIRAAENGLPWGGHAEPDPPLHCFPMRESFAREPERQEFPAPMISSTESDLAPDPPAPVAGLAAYAAGHGWDHMLTYARGWVPHARLGTPGANPKTSWAVRLRRGPYRAVAVRMHGDWTSLWTWSSAESFTRHKLLEMFKEALR